MAPAKGETVRQPKRQTNTDRERQSRDPDRETWVSVCAVGDTERRGARGLE